MAGTSLYVDKNNILQPLGVLVLGDSRYSILPATRDNAEEIPGRDGEIDFGSELRARPLELYCAIESKFRTEQQKKRAEIARYLDPRKGVSDLIFADDPEKIYKVKYSGQIGEFLRYPLHMKFTIPFKMFNPFIVSATEHSLTGSGVAVNAGTEEAPVIIEIAGPVTNPTVKIRNETLAYTGTIALGGKLAIDTGKLTAKLLVAGATINVLNDYNGVFPKLQPGSNTIVAASGGTTTIRWRDMWL